MQVQVHTDANIEGREGLVKHVTEVVEHTLARYKVRITRVEVHLSDEHGKSGVNDKKSVMEARVEGHQPVAVTAFADTLHQAIDGAADKLLRALENTFGRLDDRR
jgi:ribosomal subunit interface protein